MEALTILLPAAYVAAMVWAIGGDFLRAQLDKDLEQDPPSIVQRLLRAASLPTACLVGALLLRLLIHVKGLLLTALIVAAALSLWKAYRAGSLRAPNQAVGRPRLG